MRAPKEQIEQSPDLLRRYANLQCKSPDVDGDGLLTITDFDFFFAVLNDSNPDTVFDFNNDGNVNVDDLVAFVTDDALMNTFFGDTDYNQEVDFADFLSQSGAFNSTGGWGDGDTDGDGDVDFADFLKLSGNFGIGD